MPDNWTNLRVSTQRKFTASFGPKVERNDDGTTTDFQGRMTGALNDSKTKIVGTWRMIASDHDAAGAVTDSCDTGLLTWSAKQ